MAGSTNSRMERTVALLLRPIARLMIASDLPITRVIELMKQALVQEAQSDEEVTDSYISLKTGVHRKDVKRLRGQEEADLTGRPPATPIAAVLSCWSHNLAFCDGDGPRALSRRSDDLRNGFDDLVRTAKVDLPPATVLAELLAQGIVATNDDGLLILVSDTYIPKFGDAVLDAFEATVIDHLKVATANVMDAESNQKSFDRVLRYSHLSQASVDQLESTARAAAIQYLNELNALAHELQATDDADGKDKAGRFVTGVFTAPQADEKTELKGSGKAS